MSESTSSKCRLIYLTVFSCLNCHNGMKHGFTARALHSDAFEARYRTLDKLLD